MRDHTWLEKWNERYTQEEFVYGTEPNLYLQEKLASLKPGTILFPADGEGRNSVYSAMQGWKASAFDISKQGRNKALQLAAQNNVSIDYQVGELQTLRFNKQQFDVIALIYAHFPGDIKSAVHRMLDQYLRKGGFVIFEAFSKKHLGYVTKNEKVGGPRDLESLFSIEEINADFPDYDIKELKEVEIELNEGLFHNGTGSVIRFVGQKR
ncbi:class I SAM-dependent methyltransferase [Chryseobacterium indologenes]|uniref:class I SAM-dependent methyltransferase n=1 Tax=Chryseobacterium indologenes TaxID=253 RepID=UPI000F4D2B97|nr:class I SAM-dependent methyltransferase [Chryseobacterium indologenes]AYZ35344.1 class I SAM-dependent methyltransferase [Chryseobacterium indologenes]MBF6644086.1 class I SAM-dependent methyltransferase [Chryseobacterium indologenes]MBU3048030.1 class I SAM-dependent methyltransferase [Chryseobacterium indologenes]MEB4761312.1 class I SAM-dependent methyltransferase [Chryseobacterium indologenes]QQQ72193.1 class I SAM-dependent methyltransferase [Chryseobacterium indologenes]